MLPIRALDRFLAKVFPPLVAISKDRVDSRFPPAFANKNLSFDFGNDAKHVSVADRHNIGECSEAHAVWRQELVKPTDGHAVAMEGLSDKGPQSGCIHGLAVGSPAKRRLQHDIQGSLQLSCQKDCTPSPPSGSFPGARHNVLGEQLLDRIARLQRVDQTGTQFRVRLCVFPKDKRRWTKQGTQRP
jgi:hypothetical protein